MYLSSPLNAWIKRNDPGIFSLLSKRGKAILFPNQGIIKQSEEAKGSRFNATIGVATNGAEQPLVLPSLKKTMSDISTQSLRYCSSFGLEPLRRLWLKKITTAAPQLKKHISLPVVAAGITHSLFVGGYLVINKNDSVILPNPFWENYSLMFQYQFEARLKTFLAFTSKGFHLENFRKTIQRVSGKKKIILLNFPNNPTGYTLTNEEAETLSNILKEEAEKGHRLVVLIDDAYFGLTYESNVFKSSLFDIIAPLHENILALKIDGASKELYAWGLRAGFITFGSKNLSQTTARILEDKAAAVVRSTVSNASKLSQEIVLQTIKNPSWKKEAEMNRKILAARYRKVKNVLKQKKFEQRFTPLPYNSGYFLCLRLKRGLSAERVRKQLLKKYKTGVIAWDKRVLRISYSSLSETDIPRLFENVFKICCDMTHRD